MPIEILTSGVRYAAKTKLVELALEIAETRNLNKVKDQIRQGAWMFLQLQALDYSDYLSRTNIDRITACLVESAEINDIPVAPYLGSITPPSILVGIPGNDGEQGTEGPEGGGVPFSYEDITSDTVVDSFALSTSPGVEYQIVIQGDDGMRVMRLIGGWSDDGADYGDDGGDGTDDIYGDTSDVSMSIIVSGSTVQLLATVIPGSTWNISGTRKYIPNNGNGIVNPTSLTEGKIWIGDSGNSPVAQTLSGDVTVTSAGVTAIGSQVIVNADISASAAIAVSKLAALTASKAVVTDSSGYLTTATATTTEINYLSGLSGNVQTQLDGKVSAVTGGASTIISSNLTPSYTLVSNPAGKVAVSSVNTTELGHVQGVTSNIQLQLNSRVLDTGDTMTGALVNTSTVEAQGGFRTSTSGDYFKTTVVNLGDWNMDTSDSVTVAHGIADYKKIRSVDVIIRDDADSAYAKLTGFRSGVYSVPDGGITDITSTTVTLFRTAGQTFDGVNYNATSFNRGFMYIQYIV